MPADPITILIADDHTIVRDGLSAVIDDRPDMHVIGSVGTGQQAVELALAHHPDIILMDLRMPQMNGVDAIVAIRTAWPDARVIVLTTYDGDEDIYRAIQAGAQGYLLKDTPRSELFEAIGAVHNGHKRIPPNVAAKLAERLTMPELTQRELEVLKLIVDGKSNREIGAALHITEGTVKFHVNHILSKMGVQDRTQVVTEALRRGIVHL